MRSDLTYFPHICTAIVASAPASTLLTLRLVSPLFADLVDRRLLEHVVYGVREARLVSFLLPDHPLPNFSAEAVRVLDLTMSLRFADRPPDDAHTSIMGGMLEGRIVEDVAGISVSDELWSGNAKAPWVLADPPRTPNGSSPDEVQLPDALPHFPNLRVLRSLNYQPVVFPHLLRYTCVPVVVYPASRAISWSPSRRAGGRLIGGSIRAPRAVIAFDRPPEGDFSFYFRARQHERLDIVLVPGQWKESLGRYGAGAADPASQPQLPPSYDAAELPRYTTSEAIVHTGNGLAPVVVLPEVGPRNPLRGPPLVDRVTSGTFWTCLTDEVAHHVENGGTCTVVGLEAWDIITRGSVPGWDGSWAEIMTRDVAVDEMEELGLEAKEGGVGKMGALSFATLDEWRDAEENTYVWDLVI